MADGERTGKPKAKCLWDSSERHFIIHELSIKLFLFGPKRVTSYMKHHFIEE